MKLNSFLLTQLKNIFKSIKYYFNRELGELSYRAKSVVIYPKNMIFYLMTKINVT